MNMSVCDSPGQLLNRDLSIICVWVWSSEGQFGQRR